MSILFICLNCAGDSYEEPHKEEQVRMVTSCPDCWSQNG
jgi:hypothetical protein